MSSEQLMKSIWDEYSTLNPIVSKVHQLLKNKNEIIENDHIAYRTVRYKGMGIDSLAKHFIKYGYTKGNEYHFPEKKLYALHFNGPKVNDPKVFISEIILDDFSANLKNTFTSYLNKTPNGFFDNEKCLYAGAPWGKVSFQSYQNLINESEYAAWLMVFGFRANHFTVNINRLKSLPDLVTLNDYLKKNQIVLNSAGGEIKGTPDEFLEQSSTMANKIKVQFQEGEFEIPCCYYEFAKRYKMPNGEIFHGFIANSANKIFESTNVKPSM